MRSALMIALVLGLSSATAQSADIKILTAGAFKPVVTALAPQFEKATGHTLVIDNDTAGGLSKRIEAGEAFDVVFLPPATLGALSGKGFVSADGQANVAQVGIGVAVKEGAPLPDIASVDGFKTALQNAKAIAVIDPKAGGSSGIYLADLFQKWGIADTLKPKLVLVPGGLVATRLMTGEADLAIHQISEILAVKGARLVGPLPADIQNFTVYRGALATKASQREPAAAFLELLKSPAAAAILKDKGMEPPR